MSDTGTDQGNQHPELIATPRTLHSRLVSRMGNCGLELLKSQ